MGDSQKAAFHTLDSWSPVSKSIKEGALHLNFFSRLAPVPPKHTTFIRCFLTFQGLFFKLGPWINTMPGTSK